jgi:hypothetical protein
MGTGSGEGAAREMPVDLITIMEVSQIEPRREALRQVLWGTNTLPTNRAVPHASTSNCASSELADLAKVEELRVPMTENEEGLACHYVPNAPNGRLVIYNPGHIYTMFDGADWEDDGWWRYGNQRTLQALMSSGYGVLVVFMPHYRPDDAPSYAFGAPDPHVTMFANLRPAKGSVWKYFIEPVVASINYLTAEAAARNFPAYNQIDMMGLSGGGWTTVVAAAVDTRIKVSIQVAGTAPLEYWRGNQNHDEQTMPELYRVAAYRDLYILGASGAGRRQIQVLNRYDDCCFFPGWMSTDPEPWEASVKAYSSAIQAHLADMGGPAVFELKIDEVAVSHQISADALKKIVMPALGAASAGGGNGDERGRD